MKILLDTHVLLWTMQGSGLSDQAREAIISNNNVVFVSIVSLWELRIKQSLKKITLPKNFYDALQPAGYEILPVTLDHIKGLGKLPNIHRDPFDRMLVSQARCEQLVLVTEDKNIKKYTVQIL